MRVNVFKKSRFLQICVLALCSVAFYSCEEPNNPPSPEDFCPNDPDKTEPGVCGCGIPDIINPSTGYYECNKITDLCPSDQRKTQPGVCGCGVEDTINPDTGMYICLGLDLCPDDPQKTLPGVCGCGVMDTINENMGVPNCIIDLIDLCPDDPYKELPGICGCGNSDTIDEQTGIPECISEKIDLCPENPDKMRPGICGCAFSDDDTDGDTIPDCHDECPEDATKTDSKGICGCGKPDSDENISDSDSDTIPNCIDFCPDNGLKVDDDGCACDEWSYELEGKKICPKIIRDVDEFITLHDNWNNNAVPKPTYRNSYILMNHVNLGEKLTSDDAMQWIGIGTPEHPFDGVFIGNGNTVTATRAGSKLTLGNEELDNVGLFSFVQNAKIDNLNIELNVKGNNNVGPLIGSAESTTITNISSYGTATGNRYVGGLIGLLTTSSTIKDVCAYGNVSGSIASIGGLIGESRGSYINRVCATGKITGPTMDIYDIPEEPEQPEEPGNPEENPQQSPKNKRNIGTDEDIVGSVGGLIGSAISSSRIYNAHATGAVTGFRRTGGLIGLLQTRSVIINAYASGAVTCSQKDEGGLIGVVDYFCTIKNAYATGYVLQESSETENAGALIGRYTEDNNDVQSVYWWPSAGPTLAVSNKDPSEPVKFLYQSLIPVVPSDSTSLLNRLNTNIGCKNSDICSIDDITCTKWTTTSHKIGSMTMTIPTLKINPIKTPAKP